ncbi:MAG: FtsK/SpoIIIE domain-containing protein [Candidatus Paceibacterota bacterium]|jgi:S-DNA-T family DNA segregation ATPase FtsK/SpoIIIE
MNTNLTINLAKDEYDKDLVIDLTSVKHLLVAGSTGSGKSVLLHNILSTLLTNNTPEYLKLVLIDPKRIEMAVYNKVPHLLTPVITDPKKAILAMKWAGKEIERRFEVLKNNECKDIDTYHNTVLAPAIEAYKKSIKSDDENHHYLTLPETMPHIVIVIDEYSGLVQAYPKEVEPVVLKIAQMGHAVGIHIIISTSRLGTKIFTAAMRDAIGTRIAMQTYSVQDSKLIIGTADASILRGAGDMLYRDGLRYIVRGQGKLISYEDVKAQCKSLQDAYKDEVTNEIRLDARASDAFDAMAEASDADDMYDEAREAVISAGKASTSYIQRKLGIGYSRSAKLMDMLEERGVIGPANGSEPREVIVQSTVS